MPEGATLGAGAGGVIGGTIGLLAGIGALVIPGFGPLIAAGPITAVLTGGAIGAGVVGLTGPLMENFFGAFKAAARSAVLRTERSAPHNTHP